METSETILKGKPKKVKIQDELELLRSENSLLNEKILRLSAEMQNMKRRNDEDFARVLKYEGESFIKELLSIVDNLERAILLDDTNLDDEVSKFLAGIKMIYGNLISVMKENEIVEIEALNREFDPITMEAVMTESVEKINPNMVIDVMQKGYMYKDKVIRVAMVKVNK